MDTAPRFWNLERILVAFYLAAAAGAFVLAGNYRDNSGRLPRLVAAVIVVLTAYLLAGQYLRWRRLAPAGGSGVAAAESEPAATADSGPTISVGRSLVLTLGFLLAAYLLGFELAILVFATVTSRHLGLTWTKASVFGVVFSGVLWAFFNLLLHVVLPQGVFFSM